MSRGPRPIARGRPRLGGRQTRRSRSACSGCRRIRLDVQRLVAPEPPGDLVQEVVQEVLGRLRAVVCRLATAIGFAPRPSFAQARRAARPPRDAAVARCDRRHRGSWRSPRWIEFLQVLQDQHLAVLRLQPVQRRAPVGAVPGVPGGDSGWSRHRPAARPARSPIVRARAGPAAPRGGRSAARRGGGGDAGGSAGSWPGLAAGVERGGRRRR